MTPRIQRPAAALTITLALALSGCAGADEAPDGAATPPSATGDPSAEVAPPVAVIDPTPAPDPVTAEDAAGGAEYAYSGVTVSGGPDEAPTIDLAPDFAPVSELASGDVWVGEGEPVAPGATVTVQYTGIGQQTRSEFDSSWSRGAPATFGLDQVIVGWQEGIVGMRPGGRRLLVIPGTMAYGPNGNPPVILPDETLVFVVDLIEAQSP